MAGGYAALLVGLLTSPAITAAQTPDTALTPAQPPTVDSPPTADSDWPADYKPEVMQYDLAGPRFGATFMPNGLGTRTQFGWHFENQAAPGSRGPWFIVERVFLVGGVERSEFIPSGTLIFGIRLPSSFEFGIGPSVTLGGPAGASTAVVAAAGQTLYYGGIRVPLNVAVAMNQDTYRVTLITGWAIRDRYGDRSRHERPRRGYRDYGGPGR